MTVTTAATKVYLNGIYSSGGAGITNGSNSEPLLIGTSFSSPCITELDEVQIFSRALDPAEILAIFDAGSAGKCKCEPLPDGSGCKPVVCSAPLDECVPVCAYGDPFAPMSVTDCDCLPLGTCHLDLTGILPACVGDCPSGQDCVPDITQGGLDFCCRCACPTPLPPEQDICGLLQPTDCTNGGPDDLCRPTRVHFDLVSGEYTADECDCLNAKECYIDFYYDVVPPEPFCNGLHCPGTNRECELTTTDNNDGTVSYDCCGGCIDPPPDMVAWWPLDELTGATAVADLAGNVANNGTPMFGSNQTTIGGGPTSIVGDFVANSLQFGISRYVEVLNDTELNFGTGPFSIDAWVRFTPGTQTEPIVYKLDANGGYFLYIVTLTNGATWNLALQIQNQTFLSDDITASQGSWIFVAATRQGSITTLYVNNDPPVVAATPLVPSASSPGARLWIGRWPSNPHASLAIDELEIFERALTQTEVETIYQADSAGKCKDCKALPDGSACQKTICPNSNEICKPTQLLYNPSTEQTTVTKCDCVNVDQCYIEFSGDFVCQGFVCPGTNEPCQLRPTPNPDGTFTYDCCQKEEPCPLEGNYIPYDPCLYLQGTDCNSDAGPTCLPVVVQIYDSPIGAQPGPNYPRAEKCACAEQFTGPCGPITIKNDPGTNDYALSCFGSCPGPSICDVFLNGVPQGQDTVFTPGLTPGDMVTCECPPPRTFDECGVLIQGVECVLFQADGGGVYVLGNHGAFAVGARVRVTGVLNPNCNTVCLQGDGCIENNTIAWEAQHPCGIPTLSEWGLVVLTLVLLIVAKVYFARRRTARA